MEPLSVIVSIPPPPNMAAEAVAAVTKSLKSILPESSVVECVVVPTAKKVSVKLTMSPEASTLEIKKAQANYLDEAAYSYSHFLNRTLPELSKKK